MADDGLVGGGGVAQKIYDVVLECVQCTHTYTHTQKCTGRVLVSGRLALNTPPTIHTHIHTLALQDSSTSARRSQPIGGRDTSGVGWANRQGPGESAPGSGENLEERRSDRGQELNSSASLPPHPHPLHPPTPTHLSVFGIQQSEKKLSNLS